MQGQCPTSTLNHFTILCVEISLPTLAQINKCSIRHLPKKMKKCTVIFDKPSKMLEVLKLNVLFFMQIDRSNYRILCSRKKYKRRCNTSNFDHMWTR